MHLGPSLQRSVDGRNIRVHGAQRRHGKTQGCETWCAHRYRNLRSNPSPHHRHHHSKSSGKRHSCSCVAASSSHEEDGEGAFHSNHVDEGDHPRDAKDTREWDVSSVTVKPQFRDASHVEEEAQEDDTDAAWLHVAVVSESGLCRAPLGAALLRKALGRWANHVDSMSNEKVQVHARASKTHCSGLEMERDAKELGDRRDVLWQPQDGRAKPIQSVSKYDLVLVVDKYALEDVMRDAAVDDLARKAERGGTLLSTRVRLLGEYATDTTHRQKDVEDPLYGNAGGETQRKALEKAAEHLEDACNGVARLLQEMVDREEHQTKEQCQKAIQEYLEKLANDRPVEWMKPPMLQDKA